MGDRANRLRSSDSAIHDLTTEFLDKRAGVRGTGEADRDHEIVALLFDEKGQRLDPPPSQPRADRVRPLSRDVFVDAENRDLAREGPSWFARHKPSGTLRFWFRHASVFQTGVLVQEKSPQGSDLSPIQVRMARTGLVIGIRALATAARVSTQTLVRLERGAMLRPATMARIRAALEKMGAEFGDDGASVTVRSKTSPPGRKASKKPLARKRRRTR